MRCRFSGAMPEPVSADDDLNLAIDLGGYMQHAAVRHRVLCVEKQIQKDLLQFSRVAQNLWQRPGAAQARIVMLAVLN